MKRRFLHKIKAHFPLICIFVLYNSLFSKCEFKLFFAGEINLQIKSCACYQRELGVHTVLEALMFIIALTDDLVLSVTGFYF